MQDNWTTQQMLFFNNHVGINIHWHSPFDATSGHGETK